jgi:hypothetical protein
MDPSSTDEPRRWGRTEKDGLERNPVGDIAPAILCGRPPIIGGSLFLIYGRKLESMLIQKPADLIFMHDFGGAYTREITMKGPKALQQLIGH